MPADIDFDVYDADNHLYEAEDALTRHLPEAHRNLFRFVELKGRKKLVVRDRLTEFIPNPTFEVVARPGAHMAFYAAANAEGKTLRELTGEPMRSIPAFREPGPRLELLDEQGVHTCLMYPTLASLIEERLLDDPALTQVAIRAFNEWLYDEWRYDYEGRIYSTPLVNPCIVEQGIAELDRVIERGARAVLLRPAPVSGLRGTRSPFLPEFDPFWARVQEAGILVALHASDSGYTQYLNTWEGTEGEFVAFRPKTFMAVADDGRSIQDALASAICHGMLDPLPRRAPHQRRERRQLGRATSCATSRPRTRRCRTSSPSTRSRCSTATCGSTRSGRTRVVGLVELIGSERVCFGSDYPHPEGLDDPLGFRAGIDELGRAEVERIMSTNLKSLLAA